MVSKSGRSTQDKNWSLAMSCCREALRPITAKITQADWDRRLIFIAVRMGDFTIVKIGVRSVATTTTITTPRTTTTVES
eukprot:4150614-Pyramimonas_sp.AAC.1